MTIFSQRSACPACGLRGAGCSEPAPTYRSGSGCQVFACTTSKSPACQPTGQRKPKLVDLNQAAHQAPGGKVHRATGKQSVGQHTGSVRERCASCLAQGME